MSTNQRIKNVSLTLFACNGYEGTSIEDIAGEVGIKKSSIYSHFKSKEDLYLQIFNDVLNWDNNYFQKITDTFIGKDTEDKFKEILMHYCHVYTDTLCKDKSMFLNRAMIFPPQFLKTKLQPIFESYEKQYNEIIISLINEGLKNNTIYNIDTKDILSFFYCVVDGLFVESCYYPYQEYLSRFNSIWPLFWRSIKI